MVERISVTLINTRIEDAVTQAETYCNCRYIVSICLLNPAALILKLSALNRLKGSPYMAPPSMWSGCGSKDEREELCICPAAFVCCVCAWGHYESRSFPSLSYFLLAVGKTVDQTLTKEIWLMHESLWNQLDGSRPWAARDSEWLCHRQWIRVET